MDTFLDVDMVYICRPYLCSPSVMSKQVCPVLKAVAYESPKHRLATPSKVCRMCKGAQQNLAGRRGTPPWLCVASWRLGSQGRGWPWEERAGFPDRLKSSVIVIF